MLCLAPPVCVVAAGDAASRAAVQEYLAAHRAKPGQTLYKSPADVVSATDVAHMVVFALGFSADAGLLRACFEVMAPGGVLVVRAADGGVRKQCLFAGYANVSEVALSNGMQVTASKPEWAIGTSAPVADMID